MQKYMNNTNNEFIVLKEYDKKIKNRTWVMWLVQFTNTGTTKEVYKNNALKGKILDPYEPSVLNIGYNGIHNKPDYWKKAKRLWSNMLKRCYDPNYKKGYYGRGYIVDKKWHCFANFLNDLPDLENFDKWLNTLNNDYPKYNLDKDLKFSGNKIYSKECCMFVTEYENKSEGAKNGKPYSKKKNSKMGI